MEELSPLEFSKSVPLEPLPEEERSTEKLEPLS